MSRTKIHADDIVASVRSALQFISCYHSKDFLDHLHAAYLREQSLTARGAIAQTLANSRMAAIGKRPICQDTGMVTVFARLGQDAQIVSREPFEQLINQAVRLAYLDADNPLRASMVSDPMFSRQNTGDNTPAVTHVELVKGSKLELTIAAKGFGSENKSRFSVLNPGDSVADWVVDTVGQLGAGWCPPGIIAIGVGGTVEKAMLIAKQAVLDPLDMTDLIRRGPENDIERLRLELYDRINNLGVGAQGLGGVTTVLDVKIATYPTHAASLPVALIPQCVASRHISIVLDGNGPDIPEPPLLSDWPAVAAEQSADTARQVNIDTLTRKEMASWKPGETLLLSGKLLTGRDAAHKRIADMQKRGEKLPVSFRDRLIYYVGPVDAVRDEVIGPAGPTTSLRMDKYTDMMLDLGLLAMVGKAERGAGTIASIAKNRAAYLVAVGGAAILVSRAIRKSRVVAFAELGMEAIHEFEVQDMPVLVAVSPQGRSVHSIGPVAWRCKHNCVCEPEPGSAPGGPEL